MEKFAPSSSKLFHPARAQRDESEREKIIYKICHRAGRASRVKMKRERPRDSQLSTVDRNFSNERENLRRVPFNKTHARSVYFCSKIIEILPFGLIVYAGE